MRSAVGLLLGASLIAAAALVRGQPPATEAAEDEALVRAAKLPADGPGLLEFFRRRTLSDAERQRVAGLIGQLGNSAFNVREKASRDLSAVGPPALSALRQALKHGDAEVQNRAKDCIEAIEQKYSAATTAAALRLLRVRQPAGAAGVLVGYGPFADDEAVEQGIFQAVLALTAHDGKIDPVVAAALKDKEPVRRALAAVVLGRYGNAEQQAAVRALLADPDPKLRLRSAQGLLAARDKQAVSPLLPLLTDAPPAVAEHAEDLLNCLAGARGPQTALGEDPASRQKCRAAWEAWWRANQATLDLKDTDLDLVLTDPAARARDLARQFLSALVKGDAEVLKKTTDVPFCLMGLQTVRTRNELDQVFAEARRGFSGAQRPTFFLKGVVSANDYLKTAPAAEKDFLTKDRPPELRVVYVQSLVGGKTDSGAVFVKLGGGRVVGMGGGKPAK